MKKTVLCPFTRFRTAVLQRGGSRFLADDRQPDFDRISSAVKRRFFRRQLASFSACKLFFSANSEFFTHLCTCRYLFDFYTLFSCNPAVFLETSGFFQITTPRVLFLPSQQPPRKSPKLPAPRADVTAAGRARPRGFVLLRRLRLLPLPKFACSRSFSAFAVSAMLPHVGATSGFLVLSGYALDCTSKAAQAADTGSTAW